MMSELGDFSPGNGHSTPMQSYSSYPSEHAMDVLTGDAVVRSAMVWRAANRGFDPEAARNQMMDLANYVRDKHGLLITEAKVALMSLEDLVFGAYEISKAAAAYMSRKSDGAIVLAGIRKVIYGEA